MTKWWIALTVVAACGGGGNDTFDAPQTIDGSPPGPDARIDAEPGACTGDGTGQGNGGFIKPAAVGHAWEETSPGTWFDLGPADWSCAPRRLETLDGVTNGGTIVDQQTGNGVANAVVEVFLAGGPPDAPDDTVTADVAGFYVVDVPSSSDLAFRVSAADHVTTVHLAVPTPIDDLALLGDGTANALPALVGEVLLDRPLIIGRVEDCAGHTVDSVVVTASVETDCVAHGQGAKTFYFNTTQSLPVRNTSEAVSTENGMYMVMLDAMTTGQVQIWGFADGDDPATAPLHLLATRTIVAAPLTVSLIAIPN